MDDQRYYRRRVTEEQIAALGSEDARVRRVHIEMAGRYRDLVRSVTSRGEGELRWCRRTEKYRTSFLAFEIALR